MEEKKIEIQNELSLVSIIVPCYNYAHFLPQTLNSVLNQSYQYWECIIVDDGSIDNTKATAHQFVTKDSRFKYIYQNNQGLSAARNTGLAVSKGEYIQFLDADDLIEYKKLEFQVDFLEKNLNYDVVYSRIRYFNFSSEEPKKINLRDDSPIPRFSGKGLELFKTLINNNITAVHAPLIRNHVFKRAGNFDMELKSLEDWDFWWRCALKGMAFKYLNQENTCALYRIHSFSMSRNKSSMKYMELKLRKRMMASIDDSNLLKINNAYIKNIKTYLYKNAWGDVLNKDRYIGAGKIMDIYKLDKRLEYLCDYLIVKYLPKSFAKPYYIIRAGELKNAAINWLKKLNIFKIN